MIRLLHRWPGLVALALLVVLSVSGAALSVFPAMERIATPVAGEEMTVAQLASRIQAAHPGVEQIKRAPSGRIRAYWFADGQAGSGVIDPRTGEALTAAAPSAVQGWLTDLHRSLFLGDFGRWTTAGGAAAMLVLALSGACLVARRTGGWRRWFGPVRGSTSARLHTEIARVVVFGLALSSVTALWMTASTFGYLPEGEAVPTFPDQVSGSTGAVTAEMPALRDTPVRALRELTFPYPSDPTDVFTLSSNDGTGYIDQGTGALLAWEPLSVWQQLSETIYMLHTGQGAAFVGLALGITALGVPVMGITGAILWWCRRRARPRIRDNRPAAQAQTVILVGSEGGSTWGFAATLHRALIGAGQAVHTASMSSFAPERYTNAERVLVLAATYGDGEAPSSASGFLERLAAMATAPTAPLAILGFGARNFPAFCAYARRVEAAAQAKGWEMLLPMDTVDRQSPQDFARWGRVLGATLGLELELAHQPQGHATRHLTLVSRRDYGTEVQAPTSILRFALPRERLWQRLTGHGFGRFTAGDLLGIVPEGSELPRLYSLASGRRDGFIEIVVRKHPGGLCSGQLVGLEPGQTVRAFLRRHPDFKPGSGRAPLILIGAGTGVGPLAGFIRENTGHRPVHLFFGMRHPDSDFLYDREMTEWQAQGRLERLSTATSRAARPHYAQDALRAEAVPVAEAIRRGARVVVCGGRGMARGVSEALEEILAPTGLTPAVLKEKGQYVEDVY
ncbi:PepSY domain-containing protein [Arhodomonas sp. SL1]|uniref:PepSY domain-containing protein n=1 Tax=Arhodomonas sp. SL1 TaxID=3425691 RepID=UPI003F883FA1